ncbi:hypothetical protein EUTSA_v10009453mg [Eutrema salsugineum]|uniref:Agenet domain-containing protein n=1 Tax=Eutrema salsugineum TaxID=72664 RepID=V4MVP8_EUTSA|nr:DUF724 domain-containing protein 2 [Eutrema salsugineum]ESQ36286.1 hypothetical protein EUTSA_v10009453mg [Eutrema salsugineum]
MDEFVKGDKVEVCSKEEGYVGSYFEAKVLSKLPHRNLYKVKYKNLVTEGEDPLPLIEIISADELRPMPPKLSQPLTFHRDDKVDAFDLDAWWVGYITGRRGNFFSVYFETTNEKCEYSLERMRRHLDLVNGHWVSSATRHHLYS